MTTDQPPDTHHGDSHTSQSEQQTQTPTPSWQPMAESKLQDKHDTGAADQAVGLTFFQRHFTKPIDPDSDKQHAKDNRAFSFRSRGALATACIMILILLGVVGAAVGVTLTRSHQRYKSTPDHPSLVRMVLDDNFPDPALWKDGKTWYAFATNNAAGILQRPDNASSYEYGVSNIQVATSTNFLNWTLLNSTHDPLPDTGLWAVQGRDNRTHPPIPRANVWAPSVARQPSKDGKYIMYYTAARNRLARGDLKEDKQKGADESAFLPRHPAPHCIGAATASSPMGPYSPLPTPIACPIAQGGAIDPAVFTDHDHTPYLLYKVDGNNIGHGGECGNTVRPRIPTPIMLQKLSASGLEPIDSPIAILNRTASDGPLVEAPDLIRSHEGIYFLFFSSGCTRAPSYDLKYATATDIRGPYTRAERPLLQTGDWGLHAPGSAGLFADGEGRWNIVFHARVAAEQGRVRAMFVGRVEVEGRRARFVGGVGLVGRGGGEV